MENKDVTMMEREEFRFATRLASLRVPWLFDRVESRHVVINAPSGTVSGLVDGISGMIAQVLRSYPAGRVRFLLIDPVGLGQNFAAFHALADQSEKLITNRVWSDAQHIRSRLQEVVGHIETVVQKYLRSEYEFIDAYNEDAGEIVEAYRFVVIYDFPTNFDADACRALERIMANGPRCGVHVIMVRDRGKELPHGVEPAQVAREAELYDYDVDGSAHSRLWKAGPAGDLLKHPDQRSGEASWSCALDVLPDEKLIAQIVESHGKKAVKDSRVEVSYGKLLQRVTDAGGFLGEWNLDNSERLIAPLGRSGARKIQELVLGEDGTTAHHALLVGKTGSGKSNLLHVLVVSLAELYSPEQLELYLVDFKKGVEFKDYAERKLPHARVVALESDLEFGLSVLRGMDAELTRRGEAFRSEKIQDIGTFRKRTGKRMARTLLVVDECHELFSDDRQESREALEIVERIARQGRSFGMHMVLASQSISGVRIPRSILDQIGVRIAMQCSDADSRMVLADDNDAARRLDRAGEAIYNDRNGLVEGNSLFQTALLSDDERNRRLGALRERADRTYTEGEELISGPFVFEGNEPADFRACRPFRQAVAVWPSEGGGSGLDLWVGEPVAMRPAHAVRLKRQSGGNLLVVGRNEKLCFGVVFSSMLSVAAQGTPQDVAFRIVDLSSADAAWAGRSRRFAEHLPHGADVYGRRQLDGVISELAEEIDCREQLEAGQRTSVVFVLFGIQRARNLRREDTLSFGPSAGNGNVHDNLSKILREGPEFGVHTIIWCDTLQSLTRILTNTDLHEIGHRISGALSQADSVKLLDDPVASKIQQENRMVCYDDEKVGAYPSVRPYLAVDGEEVASVGARLVEEWERRQPREASNGEDQAGSSEIA